MKKKLYLPLIIFLALVAAFLVQLQRNAQGDDPKTLESALVGKPVPAKTLTDLLSTKTFDESLFKQGKPLLLNVWATWCPTCYAEHQYLNHLAKQGVPIIGLDYKDNSEKAVKWLHDLGNPYQVVLKDEKGSFALDLGVYGAPETFIVDGKGVIHYRYAGDVNERVWQEKLQPIYQKLVGAQ
ncbi:thiol:disulfide interchange protein [Aggregatibacter aphrophilus]|jgi:thiol:disulfide interchange protein dsbE|uniref:Thiol:disulfide interchange protein n=1 Tax=Aggregatibacter aphrophilus TaxID=732 RepID=A0AAP7L476_AGGAP|nr:DsbE family thiol:disulfide interchange protein [Aggregatibacter aphrophilus]AKU63107.1 thiol:disulfide interchange protein [Aggregatibacter aphrophilus]OBY54099.1 thiol:disulfide interchange protein [Aggregatibacter aphrophilus]RMW79372.1 DsbE family thiol:disulfide interchange protein [Aggregatibacter aphrophilus]